MNADQFVELFSKEDGYALMLRFNAEWAKRYHPSASRVVLYVIEDDDATPTRIRIPLAASAA